MAQKQHTQFGYKLLAVVIIIIALAQVFTARGFEDPHFDPPPPPPPADTPELRFPIDPGDQLGTPEKKQPSIDLKDPSNVEKNVEYNAEEDRFYLNEKVGGQDIKNPAYMEADEYRKLKADID